MAEKVLKVVLQEASLPIANVKNGTILLLFPCKFAPGGSQFCYYPNGVFRCSIELVSCYYFNRVFSYSIELVLCLNHSL